MGGYKGNSNEYSRGPELKELSMWGGREKEKTPASEKRRRKKKKAWKVR